MKNILKMDLNACMKEKMYTSFIFNQTEQNFVTRCFTNTQDNYTGVRLLMDGGRYTMHRCERMV